MLKPLMSISEAWRWWLREVRSIAPGLERYLPARRILLIRCLADKTEFSIMRSGIVERQETITDPANEEAVASLHAALNPYCGLFGGPVFGHLNKDRVLTSVIYLPKAVAHNLEEAISYQIGSLSPFPPKNTLYAVLNKREGRNRMELELELIITSKDYAEEIVDRLRRIGFKDVNYIIIEGDNKTTKIVRFASHGILSRKMSFCVYVFIFSVSLLVASTLCSPIVSHFKALDKIEADLADLKPKIDHLSKLRLQHEKHIATTTNVLEAKQISNNYLLVLNRLAEALDDESYLFEIRIQGGNVALSGLSHDASGIAQRLGAISDFKTVKFQGAVTRDTQTAAERFSLVMELASGGQKVR
ncbi:PilN domain-containing protein [Rhodomicrobium lacus]|uniref:PilN domain-containing protein n=1 Tax=Rhodomicrobium lacus TaxID=2498452 RepID=UPI000F8DAEEA|nr:PilN domain-containing protein [Rhodomicrobium lacus]